MQLTYMYTMTIFVDGGPGIFLTYYKWVDNKIVICTYTNGSLYKETSPISVDEFVEYLDDTIGNGVPTWISRYGVDDYINLISIRRDFKINQIV